MNRRKRTSENIWTAALFILLECAAISILRSSDSMQSRWINQASSQVKNWVWSKSENIKSYFNLKEKNKQIEMQNAYLWNELLKYREQRIIDSLPLVTNSDPRFTYKLAKVVKLGVNSQKNYFIIDKGLKDGVTKRSGVVTSQGVVGIVDEVSENIAFGRTFMNSGVSVSAKLGSSSHNGSLTWDGMHSNKAVLHGIPLYVDVQVKDTVWTSGYSAIFPSNIALGTVSGSKVKNGSTKDVYVTLFQDFSCIDYVYVMLDKYAEEISLIEKKSND